MALQVMHDCAPADIFISRVAREITLDARIWLCWLLLFWILVAHCRRGCHGSTSAPDVVVIDLTGLSKALPVDRLIVITDQALLCKVTRCYSLNGLGSSSSPQP